MVNRIIGLLNREFKNINQAAIILGTFTLLSQILAMLRDRAFAHFLGASSTLDIYYASFKIPDIIFVSVASLASITVLLPFLVDKIGLKEDGELNGGSESARKLLNDVFTIFISMMIIVSGIAFIFAPELAKFVAPGFNPLELKELVSITRIMLLSPILLGLSNLVGSVTQMFKKFFVFALSPVFYNIGIILGVVVLYPSFGLTGLAIGVVFGALLHLLIQFPVLARHHFLPKLSFSIDWGQIKKISMLSLPRTLGLALNSLALVVITALASKMGEGAISIFQFSLNFQNVPLGIIGVSYSVAAFPTLARYFSGSNMKDFVAYIAVAARQIIFWCMPIMFIFIVLRAQIVRVILGTGLFSWDDTRLTAAGLALFSLSIVGQSLILLFTRGYYAAGNTRRPLYINLISAGATIILAMVLVNVFHTNPSFQYFIEALLRIENIPHTEIVMLPLAYSIGSITNILLLWGFFRRDFKIKDAFLFRSFAQSFAGAFFIGYVTYISLNIFDEVFNIDTFWGILGQGVSSGLIGIVCGIIVLKLLKNRELEIILQSLKSRKLFKTEVISSGGDEMQSGS